MENNVLIKVNDLRTHFTEKRALFRDKRVVKAVDGVTFDIRRRETLGLVGESGCGKSTIGRTILRLIEPTSGSIIYDGDDLLIYNKEQMRSQRKLMQIIFQDPYATLNPRMTVLEIVRSPLDVFHEGTAEERMAKVLRIIELVGLNKQQLYRYPHEFSGGQRQRIVIARALVLDPEFIVCDEPVSALDVSVRSQVLNLMKNIQKELNLTYLFISHDLSVVRYFCNRIAVMYLGKIVEITDTERLFENPLHPYTRALLSAIPIPDPAVLRKRIILSGEVPSPLNPPSGCRFRTRCKIVEDRCSIEEPTLVEVEKKHFVSCFLCRIEQDQ
jgi:oligopeptide/dipeptide ABC transporter ATP-binding protein